MSFGKMNFKMGRAKRFAIIMLAGVLWALLMGVGFAKLYNYEYKTGPTTHVASQWPKDTSVPRYTDGYQLIMVAHPYCPCTKASIGELESLLAKTQGNVQAYILFAHPKQFDEKWVRSDLFNKTARIPGVKVIIDDESRQAKLFGGTTSGQTFLYNKEGKLVFMGGITESRGHSGDNMGESAIISLVNGRKTDVKTTAFFGCLLYDRSGSKVQPAEKL